MRPSPGLCKLTSGPRFRPMQLDYIYVSVSQSSQGPRSFVSPFRKVRLQAQRHKMRTMSNQGYNLRVPTQCFTTSWPQRLFKVMSIRYDANYSGVISPSPNNSRQLSTRLGMIGLTWRRPLHAIREVFREIVLFFGYSHIFFSTSHYVLFSLLFIVGSAIFHRLNYNRHRIPNDESNSS